MCNFLQVLCCELQKQNLSAAISQKEVSGFVPSPTTDVCETFWNHIHSDINPLTCKGAVSTIAKYETQSTGMILRVCHTSVNSGRICVEIYHTTFSMYSDVSSTASLCTT